MESVQGVATFAILGGIAILGMAVFIVWLSVKDRRETEERRNERRKG